MHARSVSVELAEMAARHNSEPRRRMLPAIACCHLEALIQVLIKLQNGCHIPTPAQRANYRDSQHVLLGGPHNVPGLISGQSTWLSM